jgi:multisubunit Na+/H+ antiporter MnhB subunit
MIELYILLGFMIVGALIAVEAKDLLSSVVALAIVGLGLSMCFLILKGPDVAIMQLVVETLSLIILIRATLRTDVPFSTSGRWFLNTAIYTIFFITMLVVGMKCFKDLPPFGYPIMKVASTYLTEGVMKTGATNVVSSIILDFRALDTLCEATVLFTAVISVLTIVRRQGRKKVDEVVEED